MTHVFVYGTLRRGCANHALLRHATYCWDSTLCGDFRLVSLGYFPGVVVGGGTGVPIVGEVYLVDARTLANVDRLEGHPHLYRRTCVRLVDGLECWTYIYQRPVAPDWPEIAGGDWRNDRRAACISR